MRSATTNLRQPSTIMLFAMLALAGGCSSDAVRFEELLGDSLVTNSIRTSNQQALIQRPGGVLQPFDRTADATARDGIRTVRSNAPTLPAAPTTGFRQGPALQSAPSISRTELPPVTETQPFTRTSSIRDTISNALGRTSPQTTASVPAVLPPRTNAASPLRRIDEQGVVTGPVAPTRQAGWSAEGGSRVTLRSGETLQNLSRRFGVPVEAIVAANGLSSASAVSAGQRIIIPAYSYGQRSSASAPVATRRTPDSSPSQGVADQAQTPVTTPTVRANRPRTTAPVRTVTAQNTAQNQTGSHIVAPGQTLYTISRKYNVRLDALRKANGLTGDSVRQGQSLIIPGDGFMASNSNDQTIDPTTTTSVPKVRETPRTTVTRTVNTEAPTAAPATQTASAATTFRWPVTGRTITQFGASTPSGANDGIDISVPTGTPIRAARSGTVIYAGSELEDFGKLILLSHAGGYVTAYAHASATMVKRGQTVSAGEVIAKSGATGNATEPKLHFEIRKNSQPVNPLTYLPR